MKVEIENLLTPGVDVQHVLLIRQTGLDIVAIDVIALLGDVRRDVNRSIGRIAELLRIDRNVGRPLKAERQMPLTLWRHELNHRRRQCPTINVRKLNHTNKRETATLRKTMRCNNESYSIEFTKIRSNHPSTGLVGDRFMIEIDLILSIDGPIVQRLVLESIATGENRRCLRDNLDTVARPNELAYVENSLAVYIELRKIMQRFLNCCFVFRQLVRDSRREQRQQYNNIHLFEFIRSKLSGELSERYYDPR